jgi:predicted anti-sigma-YlaC factor YlaD
MFLSFVHPHSCATVELRRAAARLAAAGLLAVLALVTSGCSLVVNKVGNSLAGGNSVFATDDDPDLVWEAVPFGLKMEEALLGQSPKNKNLLLAACSGFTQYGYGKLQQDADMIEATDLAQATALRNRARKMYLRALGYGLRGLGVDVPGFRDRLRKDPQEAVSRLKKEHVALAYWTANAWGAAISISKENSELAADLNLTGVLMQRALALDEAYELGSIHDFFISYEGARAGMGGSYEEATRHYKRALELSHGKRVSPMVSYAESVLLPQQKKDEFRSALEEALAFDANKAPEVRVANLVAQRRAKWLLDRIDELFVN